ncbi:MAG: UDP-N-acetylmuramoyl-tripeptide--D-alanyl-D-alanine ligase, partial [Bacteroidota bacterium]
MAHSKIIEAFNLHRSVSTDTRKIKDGDVFFALKGENFNGNRFASQAVDKGAAFVVIDEAEFLPENDARFILVEDCLKALQDLARHVREQFSIPVIGITGTNGKTTTKELLHAVLATEKKVHATAGNLNNHIGVPLTLLCMPEDTEVAIIEMGANKRGDIAELCDIARPDHVLLTNIGYAHLERFGDIDGVQVTKGEMFDFVRDHGGRAYVNAADPRVLAAAKDLTNTAPFASADSRFFIAGLNLMPERAHFDLMGLEGDVSTPFDTALVGEHNVYNALAAVTIGSDLGISIANMQAAIAAYTPKINRTQLIRTDDFLILLDAYNANPSSMAATLRGIAKQDYGRVALILGDMFELGDKEAQLHTELVELVRDVLPEARLIGMGKAMM